MNVHGVEPGRRAAAALDTLRSRGERVTTARRAVLEVLAGTTDHLNADEIAERASARAPGVHRTTVYRALTTLGELGLVVHTHLGGSATIYHLTEPGGGEDRPAHSHVRCTECGRVFDLPTDALAPLVSRVRRDLGVEVDPQHAALLGVCVECLPHSADSRRDHPGDQ